MIRYCCALILTAIIFTRIFTVGYSADIDGTDSGVEWDGAMSYLLVDGESNCGVDFGVMKLILDNETRAVFFCFMFIDPELEHGNSQTGISLSIENSEPMIFTAGTSSVTYDTSKYSFDGAITIDSNKGATCEVRLGIKSGLPRRINGCVRFIDSYGLPSNEYDFTIINEGYTEPMATELRPTGDNSDPAYNPGLLTEKTTKLKTTTKSANESENSRNNGNRITTTKRVGYTTEEFVINTSPPYSYERTTKLMTTQTTQNDKNLSKSNNPVTIIYHEKEIIISEVYIDEITKPKQESEKTFVETDNVTETSINLSDIKNETAEDVFTDGTKYKNIVAAVSATLIVLLAAWASKSGKKEK